MGNLTRWDPWGTRRSLLADFDRLIDDMLTMPERRAQMSWGVAVDVAETDGEFVLKASVPGIDPDDIEITLTDNVLTIRGEIQEEKDVEEESYHICERRFGQFSRSVTLPTQVDADKVDATVENGVLRVTIPKAEAVKPRRISVKPTTEKKVIEAGS